MWHDGSLNKTEAMIVRYRGTDIMLRRCATLNVIECA